MSTIDELRRTVIDTTPLYAALGVTDLAVEKAKEARVKAEARAEQRREALARLQGEYHPARLQERAAGLTEQVQQVPAVVLGKSLELAANATEAYEDLAARGERLAERLRRQQATKGLVAQAESTVALGKGYLTTVQHSVADVQRSALALVTTGHREAATTAQVVADAVAEEAQAAQEAATEVKQSAARTRTAAKRTSTTAKKATARTSTARKAATTSARKTAATSKTTARKAAKAVAEETGA